MARKQKEVDPVTAEQLENVLTFDREFNEKKDLPRDFTGIVKSEYTAVTTSPEYRWYDSKSRREQVRPAYQVIQHYYMEAWFHNGVYHRTGSKPAIYSKRWYSAPDDYAAWKPRVEGEYYLNGRKVTKKACEAGADKETSRVLMSLSGQLSFGDDLEILGESGVIYAVVLGKDPFVVNKAGIINGKVRKAVGRFMAYHPAAVEKTSAELAQMAYDMMTNMSVLG